jgi:hypothetical protein
MNDVKKRAAKGKLNLLRLRTPAKPNTFVFSLLSGRWIIGMLLHTGTDFCAGLMMRGLLIPVLIGMP